MYAVDFLYKDMYIIFLSYFSKISWFLARGNFYRLLLISK